MVLATVIDVEYFGENPITAVEVMSLLQREQSMGIAILRDHERVAKSINRESDGVGYLSRRSTRISGQCIHNTPTIFIIKICY